MRAILFYIERAILKIVFFVAVLMIVFFLIASVYGIGYLKIHKNTYYDVAAAVLIVYLIPLRKKDRYDYIPSLNANIKLESEAELLEIAKKIKDKAYSPMYAIPRIVIMIFGASVLFYIIIYLLLPLLEPTSKLNAY